MAFIKLGTEWKIPVSAGERAAPTDRAIVVMPGGR
jgi:hypothetical protein